MNAKEIINSIEEKYRNSDLVYERMLAYFVTLPEFGFHIVPIKSGSQMFRARFTTDTCNFFVNLSAISYPPKEKVTDFSRLNRPIQNIFYASESEYSCLTEMLPFWINQIKTGEIIKVTIGEWTVIKDLKLLIIPDTANLNVRNKIIKSQLNPTEIEFWDYISGKFRTTTIEDAKIYEFTSAFANALWLNAVSQKIDFNGSIYSSVQSPMNLNIALSVDTIYYRNIIPYQFDDIYFQKIGVTEVGLPIYKEIFERKHGFANQESGIIEWE